MPLSEQDAQQLLFRIYETGSGDWAPLLDEIMQFLAGNAIALISHDFSHNLGSILFASGYNQRYLSAYAQYHARQNIWLARERDYRTPGTIHIGEKQILHRMATAAGFASPTVRGAVSGRGDRRVSRRAAPACVWRIQ